MTIEELKKAAKDAGAELYTKEDKEKLLSNHAESVKASALKAYQKEQGQAAAKVFGADLEEGEAFDAYLSRVAKSNSEKVSQITAELEELQKKGTLDDTLKKRVESLENTLKEEKKRYKALADEKDSALKNAKINLQVEASMSAIRSAYKKDLDKDVIEAVEEKKLSALRKRISLDENGAVYIQGEDGLPLKNQNTFEPVSVSEYLKGEFKSVIGEGGGRRGAGTKNTPPAGSKIPAGITNRVDLTAYLQTSDLSQGEKDAIYKEALQSNMPKQ